jgi:hypothetical protein
MSANSPAIRIARVNRLLKDLEHDDVQTALAQMVEMRRALRVIHTWAAFPPLDARHVKETAAKALGMKSNNQSSHY